jgi:ABC-type multidrug transport system fused ATPase/permease subunit
MTAIKNYFQTIRFCLGYVWKFARKQFLWMFFIVAARSILPFLSAYYLGKLINVVVALTKSGISTGVPSQIWYVLLLYALAISVPVLLGNLQRYVRRSAQSILQLEVDLSILQARERIDIATYEDPKFQDLLQRAFRNGNGPIYNIINGQYENLYAVLSLIVGTLIAIHFNWIIYLVFIASAAPSFIVDTRFAARNWGIWSKDSPEQRRYSDLRQHITGKNALIETKLLQSAGKFFSWIRDILADFYAKEIANEKTRLMYTSLADVLAALGFFAALALLMRQVIGGEVVVGSLVYILSTLRNTRESISQFFVNISNQYEDSLIAGDILEIFKTPNHIKEPAVSKEISSSLPPEIVFENVSFAYPNSHKIILENLNLTLKSGSKIGLVGNNGAGKTTFVKLLCRIYDPTKGRILVNGIDLKEISTKEWWSYLGIMFQDYASYDFKAKEAIAIGRPEIALNFARVRNAADVSQAAEFIEAWKDKFEHQIGVEFGGIEPSKGQRQKLSIAKVIYRNAKIMILDEPTASVDAESEAKIFNSLENLSKDTTALLISHDFSTISECDQIFVLEAGKLIEEGDHKALMKQKGKYAELYNLQAERFQK